MLYWSQLAANLAVIVGIVFLVIQIRQAESLQKIRLAVDISEPLQSEKFTSSYLSLVDAYREDNQMLNRSSLKDDMYYVVNIYDSICVLYLHGLVQNEVLEARLYRGMTNLVPVLNAMNLSSENRKRFESMIKRMEVDRKIER